MNYQRISEDAVKQSRIEENKKGDKSRRTWDLA
jgi:hypothetical protein